MSGEILPFSKHYFIWKGALVGRKLGITINRQKFHEILVCEFNTYTQRLRDKTSAIDLRLKFRTKMDYVCRKPQYYFSYRLDSALLSQELGNVKAIGDGDLKDFEVVQTKKGKQTIESKEKGSVHGIIYQLTPAQMDLLSGRRKLEKGFIPFPVLVDCPSLPKYQMAFAYAIKEQEK